MLVLDCSNSLGSQFSDMQSYANNFISKIANNAASFSLNAPTNVTATMDENIWRVNVSWDAVKYAESYTVYRSQYPDKSFTKIAENLTGTNWQDLSLLEGNNYYRIYANGHGLTSPVSVTSNVVNCELEAPTNVTAIMYYGKRTINVSWNAVKYAESYTVYRSQYADKDFTLIADNITGTNWQDSSPLKGDNYYRIYAIGHGIISQASVTSNLVYENLSCLDNNHPHVIDMGKAGKWACCNVGASAPWEYGGYYAWGETEEKDYYDWSTYIHCDGSAYTCHNIGSDISGTKYDVAHVKWGGNWRMPSKDRINLLINNWTYEWITINGISGRLFTSSNGNAIFLPAAGYRWNDDTDIVGDYGYYWSSTQSPSYSDGAYSLYFDSGSANTYSGDRCDGLSVRPVTD